MKTLNSPISGEIIRFAHAIADRFRPETIVLFGSHAYGTPTAESDVDLLVVMAAPDQVAQAVKIRWALPAPFPLDLIVRTPERLRKRLEEGDAFLKEIMKRGVVLHEKSRSRMGAKSRVA